MKDSENGGFVQKFRRRTMWLLQSSYFAGIDLEIHVFQMRNNFFVSAIREKRSPKDVCQDEGEK